MKQANWPIVWTPYMASALGVCLPIPGNADKGCFGVSLARSSMCLWVRFDLHRDYR